MHNHLFSIFDYSVRSYGLAMASAFAVCIWLLNRRAPKHDIDSLLIFKTALWIVVGTLIGGRLLFVFTNWDIFAEDPFKLINIKEGGLVFYGGFLGSFIAGMGYLIWKNLSPARRKAYIAVLVGLTLALGYLFSGIHLVRTSAFRDNFFQYILFWNYAIYFCVGFVIAFPVTATAFLLTFRGKDKPQPLLPIIDLIMPYVGLGLAMHRSMGCFLNGCCFGRPTNLPWGVQYPEGHVSHLVYGATAHLHPTQLYQATNALLLFFILITYRRTNPKPGKTTALFFILYAPVRYGIEFLRGDILRGNVGNGLPLAGFIAVFLIIAIAAYIVISQITKTGVIHNPQMAKAATKFKAAYVGIMTVMLVYTLVFEQFRTGYVAGRMGPFYTSQFISFGIFIAGLLMFTAGHFGLLEAKRREEAANSAGMPEKVLI